MLLTKDRTFYKSLVLLAIPIALQNLVTFTVTLADNVMVGSLGDTAISGVYIGSQITTLLQILLVGIEGAILVLSAQYYGKNDLASIRRIVATGLRTAGGIALIAALACLVFPQAILTLFTDDATTLVLGVDYLRITLFAFPFFALSQGLIAAMRSVERPRVGMLASLVSLVFNISLNYILIFGKLGFAAMGVRGAAIATLISRVAEFLFIFVYVLFIDKRLAFSPKCILLTDGALAKDFFRYGIPIIAGQLVWAINTLSFSAIMGKLDYEGVIAAVSVTGTLNSLSYIVMNSLAGAVGIITGKTVGSGRLDKIREYAYTVQAIFVLLGVLTGGAILLIRDPFIALYNLSHAAIAEARALINVLSVTAIGTSYQAACLFGLVKSGGDVTFVLKNDAFFVFLVVLPASLVAATLGAVPWIVFLCLKSDQILKCIVAAVKINRFRWVKNLTRTTK